MNIDAEIISARISTPAVYVLAFFCFLSPPLVHLAELFLLIALMIDWRHSVRIFQTLYGKIFLLFVPLALLSATWASMTFGYTDSQFEQALDYTHMSLFIAAGWAIYRQQINLPKLFAVLIAGLFLSLITHFPEQGYEPFLAGSQSLRIEKIHPIQLGAYTAAIGSGLVVWLIWSLFLPGYSLRHWFGNLLLFIALVALLAVLMMTWKRGPWLGFVLAMLFLAGLKLFLLVKNRQMHVGQMMTTLVLALICISILGALGSEKIIQRVTKEQAIYQRILSGDIEDIPKTSVGWRVHMQVFAWKRFRERPLLGWGPYVKQVIDNSDLNSPWGHVHNSYWEVLLRFGLVGGILFGAGIVWLVRGLWQDYLAHPDQEPIMLSLYGALVVLSVWAMIDYKFTGWENTAFIWLLAGAASSRALRARFESA